MSLHKRHKSEIWNHYEEAPNNKAKYSYCRQLISTTGGSTGNLLRHMKTKHVGILVSRQTTLTICSQTQSNENAILSNREKR
ncbi:unnamed protein product [Lasius platythorax]|uniref:BED-type domain-containing protein n=1 Tax=Lasius platythorax TaxID=488582 RepID=A0AAV2MX11_9HYME